jgi:O-antigen/teichoic acid export membrane protein
MTPGEPGRPLPTSATAVGTERARSGVRARFANSVSVLRERRGLQAVLHTLAANVLIQGINVGTGVLAARVLLAQGRGELAAIILWPQFLAFMLTVGVPVSLVYEIKRHPEMAGALTAGALVLGVVMGLVATVIGVIGIPIVLHQYPASDVRLAQLLMVLAPIYLVSAILLAAVQAREAFATYNFVRYVSPALVLLSLTLLALAGRLTVVTAAWSYMLAGLPVFAWNLWWVRRHLRPSLKGARAALHPLLQYGLRAWGSDALGTVGGQLDSVLVVGLLMPIDMGLYGVAQSLARLVGFVPNAVVPVLFPRAAGRSSAEALTTVQRAATRTLAGMLILALPLFLAGGLLLRLVYGAEFADASTVFRLLLLEAVLSGLAFVLAQAFLATGRPGTVTLLQGLAVVTVAPLLIVFVPWLGLVGAGAALLGSTAIRLLVVALLYARATRQYAQSQRPTPLDNA